MKITRIGDALTVDCPAKVNLFLETHGVRPDGYHEIETVMQTITLYDRITLEPAPEITLMCSDPELPAGRENLAYKAAASVISESGVSGGVRIHLEKHIPAQSGLGGGSSNAAGVMAGLNILYGLNWPASRLAQIGAKIGSDVPFFIYGGTALCRGRGELIQPITIDYTIRYVLCCPLAGLSTAEVYKKIDDFGLTMPERGATFFVESLKSGDLAGLNHNLFNRLGQAAVLMSSEVSKAIGALSEISGLNATVTGSGSAVFVVVDSVSRAGEIAVEMRKRNLGRVFVAQSERPS